MTAGTRPTSGAATAPLRGTPRITTGRLVLLGVGVSLVLAGIVSYYASGHPDGLQFVAHQLGFADSARAGHDTPLGGYAVRGVQDGRLSGGLAGVIGVVVTGALAFTLTWALRRRGSRASAPDASLDPPASVDPPASDGLPGSHDPDGPPTSHVPDGRPAARRSHAAPGA